MKENPRKFWEKIRENFGRNFANLYQKPSSFWFKLDVDCYFSIMKLWKILIFAVLPYISTNQMGGPLLIDEKEFEYRKKKVVNDVVYWKCKKSTSADKCQVTASTTTNEDGSVKIKAIRGDHNHSTEKIKKRVKQIESACVQNAAINPTISCRYTYHNEYVQYILLKERAAAPIYL